MTNNQNLFAAKLAVLTHERSIYNLFIFLVEVLLTNLRMFKTDKAQEKNLIKSELS